MMNEEYKQWNGLRKIGMMLCAAFFILHSSFFISCSSINCPVQNTVSTHFVICDADGNETTLSDTLWVWTKRSDDTDTLLLNRLIGKSDFSLPISYSHPEDMLVFFKGDINGTFTLDTLWLKKDDIPHFESVDCPAHFFHQLTGTRYTRNGIDSITIIDPRVDYDPSKTHLHIYFAAH